MSDDYAKEHEEYLEQLKHERYTEALPMWRSNGYNADQRLYAVAAGMLDDSHGDKPESLSEFRWNVKDIQGYADFIEIYLNEKEAEKILEVCRKWIAIEDDENEAEGSWYHTVEAPLTRGHIEEEG
tara:strand:- start:287 stop:664 length:378 start_codon:yes stop_codon:yes gene_type:complete